MARRVSKVGAGLRAVRIARGRRRTYGSGPQGEKMNKRTMLLLALPLTIMFGCAHEYKDERPDVSQLDKRDSGLQSKGVVQASDQMAMDLLADPNLNASHTRWTIVVDHVENKTVDARHDLDIFIERLKTNLAVHGKGRVQLIENRDKLRDLQSKELENDGAYGGAPGPKG